MLRLWLYPNPLTLGHCSRFRRKNKAIYLFILLLNRTFAHEKEKEGLRKPVDELQLLHIYDKSDYEKISDTFLRDLLIRMG